MNRPSFEQAHEIARAFDKGADNYDKYAHVQQHAARLLEERIAQFTEDAQIARIVDLGCGTGTFTRALAQRYPQAALVACDIAPAMVERTRAVLTQFGDAEQRRFSTHCVDAATATFAPNPDLITSNFAMQWFADPLAAIGHHLRHTRFLAWTTLIDGTFASWISAHESRGINHGLRTFTDAASIVATCEQLAPLRLQCSIDKVEDRFPNAVEFLRSLKALGATTARADHHPKPLQSILKSFNGGFTAEYRICTILIEMSTNG